ncbi:MAG: DUF4091 domain-containing protein [Clostridia bacterium]|nr:DUF4091 domain-containing protein [Clostridia bacterium]
MSFKSSLCSSLVKFFPDSPLTSDFSEISLLSGERGNFQIAIKSDCDCTVTVKTDFNAIKLYSVKEIHSNYPIDKEDCGDTVLERNGEPGYYPDLLDNFDGNLTIEKNCTKAVWAEITTDGLSAGTYTAVISVSDGKEEIHLEAQIKILKTKLPKQELIHINWFHSDCLATYYGVEIMSEEYWRITESFIKNAVSHGVNCILTPLFTPPLDTEVGGERPTVQLVGVRRKQNYRYEFDFSLLDRWVDMCLKNGVQYFELSHLFTQWGAKYAPKIIAQTGKGYKKIFGWETSATSASYMNFLSQFGTALKEFTDKKGITDICFVHCSDEPNLDNIKNYKKASDAVRKYFSAYEHIDALSDYDFYKEGLIGTPVPEEGCIEDFQGNVPKLWTYYCCGQYKENLPNRFFSMPSIKNRILGVLLYKYNCTGFLQWGFNFYYAQYSKRALDPFKESDAGGAFPSGDSYIVYPGKDGEPLSSLRQKVFYDGIQDISALKALENKYSREYVLDFIEKELGDINFRSYPLENKKLLSFREKLNNLLD